MAAYELYTSGYSNVGILKGGFSDWMKSGRYNLVGVCYVAAAAAAAAAAALHVLCSDGRMLMYIPCSGVDLIVGCRREYDFVDDK